VLKEKEKGKEQERGEEREHRGTSRRSRFAEPLVLDRAKKEGRKKGGGKKKGTKSGLGHFGFRCLLYYLFLVLHRMSRGARKEEKKNSRGEKGGGKGEEHNFRNILFHVVQIRFVGKRKGGGGKKGREGERREKGSGSWPRL